MFQTQWKELPPDEALTALREIVHFTLERPDQQITVVLDQERAVRITSRRAHHLFQILHVLRHLDPPLADSLITDHEQLRAAAHRFPNGMDSVMEEAEVRRHSAGATTGGGGGYWMLGRSGDFPYLQALMKAQATATSDRPSSMRSNATVRTVRRTSRTGRQGSTGLRPVPFAASFTAPANGSAATRLSTSTASRTPTCGCSPKSNSPPL